MKLRKFALFVLSIVMALIAFYFLFGIAYIYLVGI